MTLADVAARFEESGIADRSSLFVAPAMSASVPLRRGGKRARELGL